MNKLRVVFYARVSTDEDDQLHSFTAQKDYFQDYITRNKDMIFIRGYADEGISGVSTKKRVEFLRMIEDARLGKFDLILTKEVSRFARNTVDTLSYTRELSSLNIGVIFTNDGIDTRHKDGELRLTIMASLAQDESRKTSERVNWAVQRNYENGVAHGSMPYGYRRNANKEIVIYEPEALVVKKVFNLYIQGLGCRRIVNELRDDPTTKAQAEQWSFSKITNMIKNFKYCGDLVQGLSYTEDFLTKTRKKQTDKDKIVYIKDHHAPIITREIFELAQQERIKRARMKDRKAKTKFSNTHLFSNKIECAHCHCCYVRKTSLKKGKRYTTWKCSKKDRRGVNACPEAQNINEDILYSIMKSSYDFLYVNSDTIKKIFSKVITKYENEEVIKKYQKEYDNFQKQFDKLVDLNIQGFITQDLFEKKYTDLKTKIELLEQKISQCTSAEQSKDHYLNRVKELIEIVKDKTFDWKNIKDELISKILYKIEVVSKEEFNVYLNCGEKIMITGDGITAVPPNSMSME